MSEVLLSDPILSYLGAHEHIQLKKVNKECYCVLNDYMKTKASLYAKYYLDKLDKHLYKLYPAVKHITIDATHSNGLSFNRYISEQTESIHIVLKMVFTRKEESNGKVTYFYDNRLYHQYVLTILVKYLQQNPCPLVKHIKISFDSNMRVMFISKRGTYSQEIKHIIPSHCYILFDVSPMKPIREQLHILAGLRPWKSFCIPYHFPGASALLNASFTHKKIVSLEELTMGLK